MRRPDREETEQLDGVSASVNYATEKASVTYSGSVETAHLVATVAARGRPPPRR